MPFDWFNGRQAVAMGTALADQVAPRMHSTPPPGRVVQELLRRVDREAPALRLNLFKRAKLANSFKWRLLEHGVAQQQADELTNTLLMHLTVKPSASTSLAAPVSEDAGESQARSAAPERPAATARTRQLSEGEALFAKGDFEAARAVFESVLASKPRHVDALNDMGAVLCKLSRHREAEEYLRRALKIKPDHPQALNNLGVVQQWKGWYREAEASFRRALKLRPTYVDARVLLGVTLTFLGRVGDARAQFEKALKLAPRHTEALIGMTQVEQMSGNFEAAEALLKRALEIEPGSVSAWAALPGLRRMSAADHAWLERARSLAAGAVSPDEAAALGFAIGKYFDDLGDYSSAFKSYREANEIAKGQLEAYQHQPHVQFVDDLMRAHSSAAIATAARNGSDSERPVFVVGMLRSGTTLTEQILASHPAVAGAGELGFWSEVGRKHEAEIRQGPLSASTMREIADGYLRELDKVSADARRVVDKALVNSDYLGVIQAVFPKARIIHLRRDPIDTCLSCYFQQFSRALNFTVDLSDLAHYYQQHHRLMAHWGAVLRPGSVLEVRYEDLVADQAGTTRRMIEFIGLPWDERCLEFHRTDRAVVTASSWQVRQRIYSSSVRRWRHYEKFVGPLKGLAKLDA